MDRYSLYLDLFIYDFILSHKKSIESLIIAFWANQGIIFMNFIKIQLAYFHCCIHAKSLQSCLTLRDAMVCSPPGSSVYGILQARTLAGVAMILQGIFLTQRLNPRLISPAQVGGFFTTSDTWEAFLLLQPTDS